MKKNKALYLLITPILMVVALACGISFADQSPKADTSIQQTLQSIQQTQTAFATATQQPTATLKIEETPLATPTITPTPFPCNLPMFQSETIPDGTEMDAGEAFVKSWRIKNVGTCTWDTSYKLVFASGDKMGGPTSKNLTGAVKPGETADVKVNLTAPSANGKYQGFWKLQSDQGEKFGNYWALIRVGPPPAAFAVSRVTYNVHPNIDMACPNTVNIKAEITSSAAGKVTYKWQLSPGGSSSVKSVTFDNAGKKIVDYNPTISASGDYEAKIYIDNPNHQWFGPVSFHVNCTP